MNYSCEICGETYLREDLKEACESKPVEQIVNISLGTVFLDTVGEHRDFHDMISIPAIKKRIKQDEWKFLGILYEGPLIEKQTHIAKYGIINVEPRINDPDIGYLHNSPWHLGSVEEVYANFLLAAGPVEKEIFKEVLESWEDYKEIYVRPYFDDIIKKATQRKYTFGGFFGNILQAAGKSPEIININYVCLRLSELELKPYWPLKIKEKTS